MRYILRACASQRWDELCYGWRLAYRWHFRSVESVETEDVIGGSLVDGDTPIGIQRLRRGISTRHPNRPSSA